MNDCLAVEDITTNMFINEADNLVDEVNLDVVFDISEPQEASEEIHVVSCLRTPTCKALFILLVSSANDL
mgnify:CR=1 FL=1